MINGVIVKTIGLKGRKSIVTDNGSDYLDIMKN